MDAHTSSDIEDERQKIQHDIQRIQDTLYDDSYSEYDSNSDSECLEIDLDQGERIPSATTDDDTRTRSSIAGSSASQFAPTEFSEGNEVDQELFINDTDVSELPITTESTLALNRAYQEVLVDILTQIENSLEKNRQKQEDFEKELIAQREKALSTNTFKVFHRQFAMPYIKDPAGGVPPPNEDVLMKKQNKEHKQDLHPDRDWLMKDRKKMSDAVAEDALQQLIQPLMIRLELEQEKRENCKKSEEKAISKRIAEIEEEISKKRSTSRQDLLKNVDPAKVDWMKISSLAYDGRKTWQECQMMWVNVLNPGVNRGKWDPEEDKCLEKLAVEFSEKGWEYIAKILNTGRTPYMCLQRYQTELNVNNTNRPWTPEEDQKLLSVVNDLRATGHRLIWAKVSSYIENRNGRMCFHRFQQIDPNMRRGAWTKEEDLSLYAAVNLCGTKSWTRLAEFVPGRSSLQCRDRWMNSLDPSLKMGSWTYEEDKKLLKAAQELGTKSWKKIADRLKGRTDNMVLQRYKRLESWKRKTKWFEELPEATRRALLGSHLTPEDLKQKESLTWQNFQKELCVHRDDYNLQERDRKRGDVVVPRPPPLLGYCTTIPRQVIENRMHLQNIIMKHVRSIQKTNTTLDQEANLDPETQQDLASKIQSASLKSISVRKLIELSKNFKSGLNNLGQSCKVYRPRTKTNYNFEAVRRKRKLEEKLREATHTLFKPRRKMKKGRPRKFFSRNVGCVDEEETHSIKVKSLNLIMKALDIDVQKMLTNASNQKQKNLAPSASASTSDTTTDKPTSMVSVKPDRSKLTGKTSRRSSMTVSDVAEKQPYPTEDEPATDVDMLRSVSEREATVSVGVVPGNDQGPMVTESHEGERVCGTAMKEEMRIVKKTSTVGGVCQIGKKEQEKLHRGGGNTKSTVTAEVKEQMSQADQPLENADPKTLKKKSVTFLLSQGGKSPSKLATESVSTLCSPKLSTTSSSTETDGAASSNKVETNTVKSLPFLPPTVTSMTAFKSLLLNRRKHVNTSGNLYNPKYYGMEMKQTPKPKQVLMEETEVNRKRGRMSEPADASSSKKICSEEGPYKSMPSQHLRNIHQSEDYKLLKSRFQSIFLWPALLSTIHPPFDRKDFQDKAKTITVGQAEVDSVQRSKTKSKGYACVNSKRMFKKIAQSRVAKIKEKTGPVESPPLPPPAQAPDPQDSTSNTDEPVKKKRGRPKGKLNRKTKLPIEVPSRSLRTRKEKPISYKSPPRAKKTPRIPKKVKLVSELRDAMMKSISAMESGERPDPAKHLREPHQSGEDSSSPAKSPPRKKVNLSPYLRKSMLNSISDMENGVCGDLAEGSNLRETQANTAPRLLESRGKVKGSFASSTVCSTSMSNAATSTGSSTQADADKNYIVVLASDLKAMDRAKAKLEAEQFCTQLQTGHTPKSKSIPSKTYCSISEPEKEAIEKEKEKLKSKMKQSLVNKIIANQCKKFAENEKKTKSKGSPKQKQEVKRNLQNDSVKNEPKITPAVEPPAVLVPGGTAPLSAVNQGTDSAAAPKHQGRSLQALTIPGVVVPVASPLTADEKAGVPMILSYKPGEEGLMYPVLNPVPTHLFENLASSNNVEPKPRALVTVICKKDSPDLKSPNEIKDSVIKKDDT